MICITGYTGGNMKGPEGKFAWTAKMGTKGQIVIPQEARELFGFQPGDTILLLGSVGDGITIVPSDKFEQIYKAIRG